MSNTTHVLNYFYSLLFINCSIPILETLPSEFPPNNELLRVVILPLISAVLIPFFQRLLDRVLPPKQNKHPQHTSYAEKIHQTKKAPAELENTQEQLSEKQP